MEKSPSNIACTNEEECWKVFTRVCELSLGDLVNLKVLDYSTTTRLAMFGLQKNVDALLQAGISHAKAHMILLFATYILHSKHSSGKIPRDLLFDQVLEFNFGLSNNYPCQPKSMLTTSPGDTKSKDSESNSTLPKCCIGSQANGPDNLALKRCTETRKTTKKKVSFLSKNPTLKPQSSVNRKRSCRSKTSSFESLRSIPECDTVGACKCTSEEESFHSKSSSCRWSSGTRSHPLLSVNRSSEERSTGSIDVKARRPARRPSLEWNASLDLENQVVQSTKDAEAPPVRSFSKGEKTCEASRLRDLKLDMNLDLTGNAPPKCPWERSTLRWANALAVDEDLADSDLSDSDSDWDSDSDSDSGEDSDEESDEEGDGKEAEEGEPVKVLTWTTKNVTMHELTLPANQVLPFRFQALFREMAAQPDMDLQEHIRQALSIAPTAA